MNNIDKTIRLAEFDNYKNVSLGDFNNGEYSLGVYGISQFDTIRTIVPDYLTILTQPID